MPAPIFDIKVKLHASSPPAWARRGCEAAKQHSKLTKKRFRRSFSRSCQAALPSSSRIVFGGSFRCLESVFFAFERDLGNSEFWVDVFHVLPILALSAGVVLARSRRFQRALHGNGSSNPLRRTCQTLCCVFRATGFCWVNRFCHEQIQKRSGGCEFTPAALL